MQRTSTQKCWQHEISFAALNMIVSTLLAAVSVAFVDIKLYSCKPYLKTFKTITGVSKVLCRVQPAVTPLWVITFVQQAWMLLSSCLGCCIMSFQEQMVHRHYSLPNVGAICYISIRCQEAHHHRAGQNCVGTYIGGEFSSLLCHVLKLTLFQNEMCQSSVEA